MQKSLNNNLNLKRIQRERAECEKFKSKDAKLKGFEDTPLEFHFTIKGLESTDFQGGYYHGALILSNNYPFDKPQMKFFTPNGKFSPNGILCISFSTMNNQQWTPNIKLVNIIETIRLHMCENDNGTNYIKTDSSTKKKLAKESIKFKCTKCGPIKDIVENEFLK